VSYLSLTDNHGHLSVLNEIKVACVIVLRLVTAITDYETSCAFINSVQHGFYSLFVSSHIRTYKACAAIAELLNRWLCFVVNDCRLSVNDFNIFSMNVYCARIYKVFYAA